MVDHTFIIHNDGSGVLTVEAKPTCGCTVAEYDKTVQPGGQGKVKTVLTTGAYAAPTQKSIVVNTNDPANKQINLTLKGSTKQRIHSEPPLGAHFGQLVAGLNLTKTFKITNNTTKTMKLEVLAPAAPSCFKVTTKDIEAGKITEVTVVAEPPFNEDMNSAQFRIKTGVEDLPELILPCSIVKPPILAVTPPVLRMPMTPLASTFRAPITVVNNSTDPIKVIGTECNDSRVKVEQVENEPNKRYTINIEIPAGYTPEPGKSPVVTIKTDSKVKPTLSVAVIAMVQPRPPTTRPVMTTAESLIGQPAPSMAATTPDGQPLKVGGGNNHVTVISFWASWCTPSRTQLTKLDDLYQKYRRKGVEFVNVDVESLRPAAEVAEAVKALDSKIPVVIDANHTIAKAYGVSQFPIVLLVGKNGVVESVRRGIGRSPSELEAMGEAIGEQIDKLLEGKTRSEFPPRSSFTGPTCSVEAIPVSPGASTGGPVIKVETFRFDAGAFKPKSQGTYKVYVRNAGGQPLEIKTVTGSNGLKVDAAYPKTLAPGATGALNCTFETPVKPEPFMHQLRVESNDPIRPNLDLAIVGVSKPFVEVQPVSGVDFSNRVRTFTVPRIATLVFNGAGTVEYKEPQSSSSKFTAEIKRTGQPNIAILTVKANPPFDQGDNNAAISIETNQPDQPTVQVPVKLYMPRRIEVNPAAILLGPPQMIQQISVTVVNSGDKPVNIKEIKKSKPEIQTQVSPEPDGMSYKLQVTLPVGFTCAPEGENVTVLTDDAEFGEIVVPIRPSGPQRRFLRPATTRPVASRPQR